MKLVQGFEETESFEDRVRSGRPNLNHTGSARVAAKMETLVSESSVESNSAREAGGHLAFHHPRYATFFMEFLINILTNYIFAMNFYHRIS
ncbi:hypothetical protein NPIL_604201 [Nephila pilipes]|uniref:Uncharacterized protein n=1 Tax=Nephila pilipes TaxID=299642 RepID=A0A8X6R211_NEPPI|nr:hypothetical protein NPIL_604201 [Nephila pilipes]